MKRSLVIHPFLFALFPILFFYSHNKNELFLNVIYTSAGIAILLTLILYSLLAFVLKNGGKAGLVVSLFLLLFFSYGHVLNLIYPAPTQKTTPVNGGTF